MTMNLQHIAQAAKLPQSFDGNPFLFATALGSLMSIACLGLAVAGWMMRDTWQDRYLVHPKSLLFNFRLMIAIIAMTAFVRCLPEVLYLQAFGDDDISAATQQFILTFKRAADTFALPMVAGWMLLFVAIYPPIAMTLKQGPSKYVIVDRAGTWPRLVRPVFLFVLIAAISIMMAYSKVYGG
jgi:hypothetical protein